uniref:Ubiquitin-like protease family profile domain-containing protein n=1 Tax=Clastoptera arizonana TaxID=38151 RepID=A0A1B6DAP7_9HEMI
MVIEKCLILGDSQTKYCSNVLPRIENPQVMVHFTSGLKVDLIKSTVNFNHIVLHIGTNNIPVESPIMTVERIEDVINNIRKLNPICQLYIFSVLSRATSGFCNIEDIEHLNEKSSISNLNVQILLEKISNCVYINNDPIFLKNQKVNQNYLSKDGLHLTKVGIESLLGNIFSVIIVNKLLQPKSAEHFPITFNCSKISSASLSCIYPSYRNILLSIPSLPPKTNLVKSLSPSITLYDRRLKDEIHHTPSLKSFYNHISRKKCLNPQETSKRTSITKWYTIPSSCCKSSKKYNPILKITSNKFPICIREKKSKVEKCFSLNISSSQISISLKKKKLRNSKCVNSSISSTQLVGCSMNTKLKIGKFINSNTSPTQLVIPFKNKKLRAGKFVDSITKPTRLAESSKQIKLRKSQCFNLNTVLTQSAIPLNVGILSRSNSTIPITQFKHNSKDEFLIEKNDFQINLHQYSVENVFSKINCHRTSVNGGGQENILRSYNCKFCNNSYKHHQSLYRHEKICNKENKPLLFCSVCNKSYKQRQSLFRHKKAHENEKLNFFNKTTEFSILEFKTIHEFENWKNDIEIKNCVRYKKITGTKTNKNVKTHYYKCIFNRRFPKDLKRKTARKRKCGLTPNFFCKSKIILKEINNDFRVKYFEKHSHSLTHQNVIFFRWTPETRFEVKKLLKEGINPTTIRHKFLSKNSFTKESYYITNKSIMSYRYNLNNNKKYKQIDSVKTKSIKNQAESLCLEKKQNIQTDEQIADEYNSDYPVENYITNPNPPINCSPNNRHIQSTKIPQTAVLRVSENSWDVKSGDTKTVTYRVSKINDFCILQDHCFFKCNNISCLGLCIHIYKCTCRDVSHLCKHVHRVHSLNICDTPSNPVSVSNDEVNYRHTEDNISELSCREKQKDKTLLKEIETFIINSQVQDKLISADIIFSEIKNLMENCNNSLYIDQVLETLKKLRDDLELKLKDQSPVEEMKNHFYPNQKSSKQSKFSKLPKMGYDIFDEYDLSSLNEFLLLKCNDENHVLPSETRNSLDIPSFNEVSKNTNNVSFTEPIKDKKRTASSTTVHGIEINGIALKSLDPYISTEEENILKSLSSIFIKGWLYDSIVDLFFKIECLTSKTSFAMETYLSQIVAALPLSESINKIRRAYNSQNFNMFNKILIPICNNNNHWVLLCVNVLDKKIHLFDPYTTEIEFDKHGYILNKWIDVLCILLKDNLFHWAKPDSPKHSLQPSADSQNCGVFICFYGYKIVRNEIPIENHSLNTDDFRKLIYKTITKENPTL